jgi:hypothetical protein
MKMVNIAPYLLEHGFHLREKKLIVPMPTVNGRIVSRTILAPLVELTFNDVSYIMLMRHEKIRQFCMNALTDGASKPSDHI